MTYKIRQTKLHGELKSPQVVNIAEGQPLLDEKSISKIKAMNEMAYRVES